MYQKLGNHVTGQDIRVRIRSSACTNLQQWIDTISCNYNIYNMYWIRPAKHHSTLSLVTLLPHGTLLSLVLLPKHRLMTASKLGETELCAHSVCEWQWPLVVVAQTQMPVLGLEALVVGIDWLLYAVPVPCHLVNSTQPCAANDPQLTSSGLQHPSKGTAQLLHGHTAASSCQHEATEHSCALFTLRLLPTNHWHLLKSYR